MRGAGNRSRLRSPLLACGECRYTKMPSRVGLGRSRGRFGKSANRDAFIWQRQGQGPEALRLPSDWRRLAQPGVRCVGVRPTPHGSGVCGPVATSHEALVGAAGSGLNAESARQPVRVEARPLARYGLGGERERPGTVLGRFRRRTSRCSRPRLRGGGARPVVIAGDTISFAARDTSSVRGDPRTDGAKHAEHACTIRTPVVEVTTACAPGSGPIPTMASRRASGGRLTKSSFAKTRQPAGIGRCRARPLHLSEPPRGQQVFGEKRRYPAAAD